MFADLRRRVTDFDVVHINTLYRFHTLAGALAARWARVPYIIQPHGALDPWHRSQRRRAKDLYHFLVEDWIIRGAAGVLCTSAQEAEAIRDLAYRIPLWVVPIGVDADSLRKPALRTEVGELAAIPAEAPLITFLGRISAKKGVELLVEAFTTMASDSPSARLIVAGPDDEGIAQRLAPAIQNAGLADRIHFVGPVQGDKKHALLQHSTVLVLPSADESFGIVVVEAMAVGCPVIVTRQVATQDVVAKSGAGLVVGRDSRQLSEAIGVVLANPEAAAEMGRAGMGLVDEMFVWPKIGGELETMYRQAIHGAASRPKRPKSSQTTVGGLSPSPHHPFICPLCRAPLHSQTDRYLCSACDQSYPIIDGIAVFVPDLAATEHDELDHYLKAGGDQHTADVHKKAQADHFDRSTLEEYEIARPHGTPRMFRFLIGEKFRRAIAPIRPHLVGATALTVCGGSGMDAEFLAGTGAHVVSSDLSLGAARRTLKRAARYGLEITSIVADIECLPFPDGEFDLVLVHDGLHHLEQPIRGLSEMARVARRWVSVTEPARAFATAIAVKVGLALEREEAGNRVARLTRAEVVAWLVDAGFRPLAAERYAMYYRHEPGAVFHILSRGPLYPLARFGWRAGNALIGGMGNKLSVVAERVRQPPSTPA